jgi:hypothetical protein
LTIQGSTNRKQHPHSNCKLDFNFILDSADVLIYILALKKYFPLTIRFLITTGRLIADSGRLRHNNVNNHKFHSDFLLLLC